VSFSAGVAQIDRPYFLGSYAQSPNGRFTIMWADSSSEAAVLMEDGPKIRGNYVLLDDRSIALTGRVEEPYCGCVADNGTFAIAGTVDLTQLASRMRVFSIDGSVLLSRKFGALPECVAVSSDGHYVAYQVCNSDHPRDGGKLTVIDVITRGTLIKKRPEGGRAVALRFEPDGRVLVAECERGGNERFDLGEATPIPPPQSGSLPSAHDTPGTA